MSVNTEALDASRRAELQAIAKQMRELRGERFRPYAMEMAARLFLDAVERGAFSGVKYLQLRYRLDPARFHLKNSYPWIFHEAVQWFISQGDGPPIKFQPGPFMEGGGMVGGYVETNIPAMADMLEWWIEQAPEADTAQAGGTDEANGQSDLYPSQAFADFLRTDTLAHAARAGRIHREKVDSLWHYSWGDAFKCWPHHVPEKPPIAHHRE